MHIQFLGATRQVTGSSYLLELPGQKILVDCGMFQERRFLSRNWDPFEFDPASLDAVLLTHAHLDHCGLLPKLVRDGFRGPIWCTAPSVEIAEIVMMDAGRIQEEDARYKAKRFKREGRDPKHPIAALFTADDGRRAAQRLRPIPDGGVLKLSEKVTATWRDAGHVLGSASITLDVFGPRGKRRLLFSGDIGQHDKPLIPDPVAVETADIVVLESTYGDREHTDAGDIPSQLEAVINDAHTRGGNVVVPTFAIERSQELLFHLAALVRSKRIPRVPVFLDSPMAINVTEVFARHTDHLDAQTRAAMQSGENPLDFPGLFLSRSHDQSRSINGLGGTAVILAGSGMCTGGRIKHHLLHNLGRTNSTLLFVGYQSPDTLGGQIVRGDAEVRVFGKMREVKCAVKQIHGLSAHADHAGLLAWLDQVQPKPKQVFLTHGEESVAEAFAAELRETRGLAVEVPGYRSAAGV